MKRKPRKDQQLELMLLKLCQYEKKIDFLTDLIVRVMGGGTVYDKTLTLPEALIALNVSRNTFRKLRQEGQIRCVEGVGRRVLILQSEINAYLENERGR